MFNKIKKVHGFTLLELLVVMAIIGVLIASSFVVFKNIGKHRHLESTARTFKNKVLLARTSAITRSRMHSVKITPTEHKRWKLVIIDSVDNILGNSNDKIADKPYFIKKINFEAEQEIKINQEGEISYFTSNPIMLMDSSNKKEIWKLPVIVYKTTGKVKAGDFIKVNVE